MVLEGVTINLREDWAEKDVNTANVVCVMTEGREQNVRE